MKHPPVVFGATVERNRRTTYVYVVRPFQQSVLPRASMRGDVWRVMCQKIVPLIVTTHINHHVRQTYVFNDSSLLPNLINGHQEFDVGLAPYPALRRQ